MAEELEIEIDAAGRVQVLTQGIKGAKCLDWVQVFQQLLGGEVENQELTPEFNQVQVNGEVDARNQVRNRFSGL